MLAARLSRAKWGGAAVACMWVPLMAGGAMCDAETPLQPSNPIPRDLAEEISIDAFFASEPAPGVRVGGAIA